jgi:hypothetical protein
MSKSIEQQQPQSLIDPQTYAPPQDRMLPGEQVYTTYSPTKAPSPVPIVWRIKAKEQTAVPYTRLSDVWFCLIVALGWTTWVVAAHVQSPVQRYAREGILVKGHVLQATCDITGGSGILGIPTYNALVDYVFDDPRGNTIKVRKSFQTVHFLEVGFANVDILVLPDDPVAGVLKSEWEQDYKKAMLQPSNRQEYKPYALLLGLMLVVVTIIGAAQAVRHLPKDKQMYGWISVAAGVTLLWPIATMIHWLSRKIKMLTSQSSQYGIILQGQDAVLQTTRCHDNACDAFDGLEGLEMPLAAYAGNVPRLSPSNEGGSVGDAPNLMVAQNDSYFVRMPEAAMSEQSDIASVSTMSSLSVQGSLYGGPGQGVDLCGCTVSEDADAGGNGQPGWRQDQRSI